MVKSVRETFMVTVNGGSRIGSTGGVTVVAPIVQGLLNEGKTAYVRMVQAKHICVTFKGGLPPETEAHDWFGQRVDNPSWVQSIVNFIINP